LIAGKLDRVLVRTVGNVFVGVALVPVAAVVESVANTAASSAGKVRSIVRQFHVCV